MASPAASVRRWARNRNRTEKAVEFEPTALMTQHDYADRWHNLPAPTKVQLVRQAKQAASNAAGMNAAAVALAMQDVKMFSYEKSRALKTKAVSNRTRRLYDFAGKSLPEGIVEVEKHPFLVTFEKANPYMNGFNTNEATEKYLEIVGRSYWGINKKAILGQGIPYEWYVIPAQAVTERFKAGQFDFYQIVQRGRGMFRAEEDEIVDFRMPDLDDPYWGGKSPAQECWESIALNDQNRSHAIALFENQARPDFAVTAKGDGSFMTPSELEKMFKRSFSRKSTGNPIFLPDDLTITPLTFSVRDMGLLAYYGASKEDIYNQFGIPLQLIKDDTGSRSKLEAAYVQWGKQTILPRLIRFQEQINQKLIPMYGAEEGVLFVQFANPVPEDRELDAKIDQILFGIGSISPDEVRAKRGMDAVSGGDTPYLAANQLPIGTGGVPDEATADKFAEGLARWAKG